MPRPRRSPRRSQAADRGRGAASAPPQDGLTRRAVPGEQLDLSDSDRSRRPVACRHASRRCSPLRGSPRSTIPAYLFEPWWPGVRARAWVDGRRARPAPRGGPGRCPHRVPELSDELPERLVEDGVMLDGWLLALDEGGWLDTDLLRRRLGGDRQRGAPGVRRLGPALVAAGPLAAAELRPPPAAAGGGAPRRGPLRGIARAAPARARCSPRRSARFGSSAISARRLDARYRAGTAGDAWLRLPVVARADTERPRLALIQRLPLEG